MNAWLSFWVLAPVKKWEIAQGKEKMISAGITPTTSGFDCPLLDRVSYENRREQIVGDYGNKMIAAMEM